jgi:hypothetical protein
MLFVASDPSVVVIIARVLLLLSLVGGASSSPTSGLVLPKCTSDLDCSLNGICDINSGICACDPPWIGNLDGSNTLPDCGFLKFTPAGSPAATKMQSQAGVFHGVNTHWTSWGASVVKGQDSLYHAFIAEMANECGLGSWTQNSQVVHGVSSKPEGPFNRIDVVVPPLSHNPQVLIAPDQTVVIYTLFDGWSAGVKNCNHTATIANVSSSNWTDERALGKTWGGTTAVDSGSIRSSGVGNCTTIPGGTCNPKPCWQCTITMHASKDINAPGPWPSYRTQIIGLANDNGIPNCK